MHSDSTQSYIVAGLNIRSEIALPELIAADPAAAPDVQVRIAEVPESLPGGLRPSIEAQILGKEVLLSIPNVGRYLVRNGCEILVQPAPGVEEHNLRLFLLGSVLGAIYFQRGHFPLHASVVVIDEQAIAFTGDSGSGKSTMAAWMHTQGYPLLCDDVCVVRFDASDEPMAYPGYPRLKLWQDALAQLEIDCAQLQRDFFRADKFHLPVSDRFWIDPVPLRHVYFLRFAAEDSAPSVEDISPAYGVHLIRNNTYRFQYISGLGLTRSHFLDCVRLARQARLRYLNRPRRLAALADCQKLVEERMR